MLKQLLLAGICAYLIPHNALAQTEQMDTLRLGVKQAERIFLEKNLQLIAKQYNIEANKALILQAKLWDNPVLNTDQNVYSNSKFFEHGTDLVTGAPIGQYYIQLQQLIKTAGKRGKLIKLAHTNAEISEWEFKDLMKNLRYELHNDFYTLMQLQSVQQLYNDELTQINKLLTGMNAEYKLGNISQKDLLRVQALQISLLQDATENNKKMDDTHAELKTLLQFSGTAYIKPIQSDETAPMVPDIPLAEMIETAKQNNTYYHLQQLQLKYNQQDLRYQKAMAVPDVTISPNYDKNSNYTPNYVGVGISFPIPLINRNQGNIKAARWQVKSGEANLQLAETELSNNVLSAYNKLKYIVQLNNNLQSDFYSNYTILYNNVVQSYKDRQLSMVEFIDYFEAYKDSRQKQFQQQLNLQLAKDELNMQVGTDVVQ